MSKNNKTTPNNEASICHWELWFEFKTHEQFYDFFSALFKASAKEELSFTEITFEPNYDYTDTYVSRASITGIWASNLISISEILDKVDYDSE